MTQDTPPNPSSSSLAASPVSRRDFLSLAWKGLLGLSSLLGLGGLGRFLSYQPNPAPPTQFDLGPVELLPTDGILVIERAQAALFSTADGFQAISLVCPHLGCEVEAHEDGFACPCHGSRFHLDGSLLKGPANRPMRALRLEIDPNGHLLLDTSES